MNKISERILEKIGQPELIEQLSGLSQSDLSSLLLEINKAQISKLTPANVLKSYRTNRFVAPSALDPAKFYRLEAEMSRKASADGIEPVLLSPVAPLGSCSVFGCVDQNNIISATSACALANCPSADGVACPSIDEYTCQ